MSAARPLVWPASPADPHAATQLSADDFAVPGGGAALQAYLVTRLDAVATEDAGMPAEWCGPAVASLREMLGDRITGGADVSAASLQLVLAYVAHLERRVAAGGGK